MLSNQVITEVTPMSSPYVSANSFGIGGTNGHILIKANLKKKEPTQSDSVPRLVCVSGRTEAAVEHMLEKVCKTDTNPLTLLINKSFYYFL